MPIFFCWVSGNNDSENEGILYMFYVHIINSSTYFFSYVVFPLIL